jgi:hypothetical protein
MDGHAFTRPEDFDVLLSDITPEDVRSIIPELLHVPFLSDAADEPRWPVEGIIYGPHYRPFISLVVKRNNFAKNVAFLVCFFAGPSWPSSNVRWPLPLNSTF